MEDKIKREMMNLRGLLKFNEPMKEHTTIKIGGPAEVWFEPADTEDLLKAIMFADAHNIPRMVFGNGSNTLVRDGGIRGIVISLARFDSIELIDHRPQTADNRQQTTDNRPETAENRPQTTDNGPTSEEGLRSAVCSLQSEKGLQSAVCSLQSEKGLQSVRVGAGVPIQKLISWSIEAGLSGVERLTGIPGTIGGAIYMNAGAGQGTIGEIVASVTMIARGRLATVQKDSLEFSYRKLKLQKNSIIVAAELALTPSTREEIEKKVHKIREKRKETQPLLWPSLGSVFKNPEKNEKAWELIDECGLRGVRVGGAKIANEHANWIINEGGATAKDVEVLIKLIRERVRERTKLTLDTEIVIVGDEVR